jgi:hypothetical protein
MNVFVLSECPRESARMMCDKHIPKMIIEAAQMLSTAHRMHDGYMEKRPSKSGKRMVKAYPHYNSNLDGVLYKAVHHYHPCTVWTMASKANYNWHYEHFLELCSEFTYRFKKEHLTYTKLRDVLKAAPTNIPNAWLMVILYKHIVIIIMLLRDLLSGLKVEKRRLGGKVFKEK